MVRIDSAEAQIEAIILDDRITTPSGLEAGSSYLYTTTSGVYLVASGSSPTGPFGVGKQQGLASAKQTTAQLVTTANIRINFDNIISDPDSTITTGATTWVFTAPYDCYVIANAEVSIQSGGECWINMYNTGSLVWQGHQGSTGTWITVKGSPSFVMDSGETFYIHSDKAAGSANTWTTYTWVTIYYVER